MRRRERDIRPPDILAEYLRLNAEDGRRLLEQAGTLEHRLCPGCHANNPQPAFTKNGYVLVHCGDCNSLYVERTPSDEDFEAFYQDSPSANYWADTFFPSVSETRREAIFQPRAAKVANILASHDMRLNVAIDVGAGAGLFLDEFSKLLPDADLRAVEPSPILCRTNRNLNRQVFEGYAAAAAIDPAWRASGDLVTCFEVIEHIVDVDAFIASLRDLCRPGGIIIISGLCGTGFDIRVLGEYQIRYRLPPPHLFESRGCRDTYRAFRSRTSVLYDPRSVGCGHCSQYCAPESGCGNRQLCQGLSIERERGDKGGISEFSDGEWLVFSYVDCCAAARIR